MCLFVLPPCAPFFEARPDRRSFASLDLDSKPMAPAISLPSRRSLLASFTTCFRCYSAPQWNGILSVVSVRRCATCAIEPPRWVCLCLRSGNPSSVWAFGKDLRVNDGLCVLELMIYVLSMGLIGTHRRFHGWTELET